MLIPLNENNVLYADQHGKWYSQQILKENPYKIYEKNKDFMSVE